MITIHNIFRKTPILEYIFPILAVTTGLIFGFMEWDTDWEELPIYGFIGLVWYIVARLFYFLITLGLSNTEADPQAIQSENKVLLLLIMKCQERASKLALSGRFIILAIVISVLGGIQIFSAADEGIRNNSGTYQLRNFSSDFQQSLNPRSMLRRIDSAEKEERKNLIIDFKAFIKDENTRYIDNSQPASKEIIISVITTRIGIVFLLIFLIQILVSLYRYNTKLLAFYNGQADLLSMLPDSELLDLDKLTRLTSTQGLDFTRQEKAPAEYALELAKKVIDKSGK